MRDNYGSKVKFVNPKKEYKTSLCPLPGYITTYSAKLNKFIATSLSSIQAMKVNDFSKKYEFFA